MRAYSKAATLAVPKKLSSDLKKKYKTQKEAAQAIGVSVATISHIANRQNVVSLGMLTLVASHLGFKLK